MVHQYDYPMNIIFQHVIDGLAHIECGENGEFYDPAKAARIIRAIVPMLAFETMKRISADSIGSEFWDNLRAQIKPESE